MDPNANLEEQHSICEYFFEGEYASEDLSPKEREAALEEAARKGERLAELVDALSQWITNGGALPTDWDPRRIKEQARNSR